MNSRTLICAVLAALPFAVQAQESTVLSSLAATCANCHGTEGRSVTKEVVPLAGLTKEHIVSALKGFKDGTRPATVMHQISKGYTDQQVEAIAAYFAAQKR
jgi:sulfide dehydrogenase cytochrome subunit